MNNTVTVGPRDALAVDEIIGERPVWSGRAPSAEPFEAIVQLRAHGEVHQCRAWDRDGELVVELDAPATGVAAGQAAVLYDGDIVLGSATIASTSRRTSTVG